MDLMVEFENFGKEVKLYNNKYKSITDGIAISMEKAEELITSCKAGIQVIKYSVIPYSIFMKALMNTDVTILRYGVAIIDNSETNMMRYSSADIIEIDNLWEKQVHIDKIMTGMIEDDVKYVEYSKYEIHDIDNGKMRIQRKESDLRSKISCETEYIHPMMGESNMEQLEDFRKDHIIVNYTGGKVYCSKREECEKAMQLIRQ